MPSIPVLFLPNCTCWQESLHYLVTDGPGGAGAPPPPPQTSLSHLRMSTMQTTRPGPLTDEQGSLSEDR